MSYHRKLLPVGVSVTHVRADAAISRTLATLALLNSAGTSFINYLLKVKVWTE